MSLKNLKKLEIIVTGYIRCNNTIWIPKSIQNVIFTFYCKNNIRIYDSCFILRNPKITNISRYYINGLSHFIITDQNELYVQGRNFTGALGIGHRRYIDKFIKHPFIHRTASICCSQGLTHGHCFIFTQNELHCCGSNKKMPLGIVTSDNFVVVPEKISYSFDSMLQQIECGNKHSVFLTLNGSVYGSGVNYKGQLSLENTSKYYKIERLTKLKNIKSIGCGEASTYCLDKSGNLYCFGSNHYGQLGIGKREIGWSKNICKISENITKTFGIGSRHVGYITRTNTLFMFGHNYCGQCGFGEYSDETIYAPNILQINESTTIMDIKCGKSHNIITTIKGDFYSFGDNRQQQCLLSKNDDYIKSPQKISIENITNKCGYNGVSIIDLKPSNGSTYILITILNE